NRRALVRGGQRPELRTESLIAVVNDHQLALGPGLAHEIGDRPLEARKSRFARDRQTTYHGATDGRCRLYSDLSREWRRGAPREPACRAALARAAAAAGGHRFRTGQRAASRSLVGVGQSADA